MKSIDIICLGRAAVDFYGQQIGSSLENMGSFAKYLGGSSANIAYGCSKLGLSSAMLTRVGNEHMGRFVRNELESVGVDTSHVITDKERLTGLVVLGIQDKETFPLIFYRKDCADMAISEEDFTKEFIASSRALLITGTHFSSDKTYQTSMKAIEYAKESDTQVIIDIDYRPVLWGLTELGDGESRFVASNDVSLHLQTILPYCDVIVGTEEEIHIAGGSEDTITALSKIRELSNSIIVLKLGPLGCTVITSNIPNSIDDFNVVKGNPVDILNVLGAGDAFMSGFLRGYLRGESLEKSANYANASGALVVSRHGCAPAIPGENELLYYIENAANIPDPTSDITLNHLHRVSFRSKEEQEIFGFAFDHRKQLADLAEMYGEGLSKITELKKLFIRSVENTIEKLNIPEKNIGVLIDDTYGEDTLNSIAEKAWWIGRPVELPGSRPLKFEGQQSIGSKLQSWPLSHVVKCLFYYHPDDSGELKTKQEQKVKELYFACIQSGHQLLLEVIPPSEYEMDEEIIPTVLKRFYDLEIKPDWWKLPALKDKSWVQVSDVINSYDPHCQGVLLLGLSAPIDTVRESFSVAAKYNICKGFTVGRTIFYEPAKLWMQHKISDQELVDSVSTNYNELIQSWKKYKEEI
ncbi:5-dehydro-2-deoxygluconokinase [Candidatus Pseudothioglobus singularis]|nr:5-dehydro-2-deoxygluconokinase [Candidatus Pseudothioglobus singularis]MDC0648797.1 5-dehydro-2-deoxygluconokinase [Candidatus Pseudothioglobus singularis]